VNPAHIRLATPTQNRRNQKLLGRNTSGFKGVSWDKTRNKWSSKITVNNKTINLGRFNNPKDAHDAYRSASLEMHGEFANDGEVA
jgi:hypothetical protein